MCGDSLDALRMAMAQCDGSLCLHGTRYMWPLLRQRLSNFWVHYVLPQPQIPLLGLTDLSLSQLLLHYHLPSSSPQNLYLPGVQQPGSLVLILISVHGINFMS